MGILRVRTVMTGYSGAPGLMTQYFQSETSNDAGSSQLGVDRVRDSLVAAQLMFPPALTFIVQGQVDELNEVTGDLVNSFNVTQRQVLGTAVTGFGPIASGICVVWVTTSFKNGRRVIGKTYLVPVASNLGFTDGTLGSSALTLSQAFGDQMDNQGATTLTFGVWSRPKNGAGGSYHQVVGNRVADKFCVLRSRRD